MKAHRSGSFSLPGGTNPFPTSPPRVWVTDWCCGRRRGPRAPHPHPAWAPDLESEIWRRHSNVCRTAVLAAPPAPKRITGLSYVVDCRVYHPRASVGDVLSPASLFLLPTLDLVRARADAAHPHFNSSSARLPQHPSPLALPSRFDCYAQLAFPLHC